MPSAMEWNRLISDLNQEISSPRIDSAEACQLLWNDSNEFLARIIGRENPTVNTPPLYSWVFVNRQPSGFTFDLRPTVGGTGNYWPAFEESYNPHVPCDGTTYVWMKMSQGGSKYSFRYSNRVIFAEITGSAGLNYTFKEIYPTAGYAWSDLPKGLTGTAQHMYGITGIPNGTKILVRRSFGNTAPQVWVSRSAAVFPTGVIPFRDKHKVYVTGATSGTFTLRHLHGQDDQVTGNLAWNISAADLKTALEALANITTVTVAGTGTLADPWQIEYQDDYIEHLLLISDGWGLKGNQEWLFEKAGDVSGPSSSTDNAIARWDGTSGKLLQNSYPTIDDFGRITAKSFYGSEGGVLKLENVSGAIHSGIEVSFAGAADAVGGGPFSNGSYFARKYDTGTPGTTDLAFALGNVAPAATFGFIFAAPAYAFAPSLVLSFNNYTATLEGQTGTQGGLQFTSGLWTGGALTIGDHGNLTGLADDDHTQYFLLAGRAGGQVAKGGTGSGDPLALVSTNHGTKGGINIGDDDWLQFDEITAPVTPGGGRVRVYPKVDGQMWSRRDDGKQSLLGVPLGSVLWATSSSLEEGFQHADGAAISRTTYADYFSLVGTVFGGGDGSTTFNLPNIQRRYVMGDGGTGTGTLGNTIGATGGVEEHTLTQGNLPALGSGFLVWKGGTVTAFNRTCPVTADGTYADNLAGSATPVNHLPPTIVLYPIVRVF